MTITVRLATPDEGPLVQALYEQGGGPSYPWLDWSEVYPFWLIGEIDGSPSGVVMAMPGKPFGRVDFLYLLPTLSHAEKACLARDLCYAAHDACRTFGSSAMISMIATQDTSWRQIATRRGWQPVCEGSMMCKPIKESLWQG